MVAFRYPITRLVDAFYDFRFDGVEIQTLYIEPAVGPPSDLTQTTEILTEDKKTNGETDQSDSDHLYPI